jgi:hypothetical protein
LPAPAASPAANTPGTDVVPNLAATAMPVPFGSSVVATPSRAARSSRGAIGASTWERVDRELAAVGEPDDPRRDGDDRLLRDRDAGGAQRVAVLRRQLAVGEHGEVVAPRAQQRDPVRGAGRAEDADPPITELPAVAVRAGEGCGAPQRRETRRVRHAVAHAACQQDAAGADAAAVGERRAERRIRAVAGGRLDTGHDTRAQLDRRQRRELVAAGGIELRRARAVLAEQAADRRRRAVARLAGIHHERAHPRAAEHERSGEAGGRAADDEGVKVSLHADRLAA